MYDVHRISNVAAAYPTDNSSSRVERTEYGQWTVYGTGGDDQIHVSESGCGMEKILKVSVNQDLHLIPLTGPHGAASVTIKAGTGNDSVFVDPNVTFPIFIDGGEGNDYLKGGSGPNALLGGPGNDILIGSPKSDLLLGGTGRDTVIGYGGWDMYSVPDLLGRLQEGRCSRPESTTIRPEASLPSPSASGSAPFFSSPPVPPRPILQMPVQERLPRTPHKPKPQDPPRPKLSDLLAAVDRYKERGFKSGRSMTKNLLASLYESPAKLRESLIGIQNEKERDDAVASFVRALVESGPQGMRLLREIPSDIKQTMVQFFEQGNAWSPQKRTMHRTLAGLTQNQGRV